MSAVAGALAAPPRERFGAFVEAELAPTSERIRAFLRIEVALLFACFVVVTFKPTSGFWTVVYLLLVSTPTVANSTRDALQRIESSAVGCAAAVLLIVAAYDEPWLYTPLQALLVGVALFTARSTPIGPAALTGGASFAVVSGGSFVGPPSALITLAFYRLLQAAIGGGIGALAQLTLWPDDPLALLRRSLAEQVTSIEARLAGVAGPLDAARVLRHFELLANAEVRHRGLIRCRERITALLLDLAGLVEQTMRWQHLHQGEPPPPALVDKAHAIRARVHDEALFVPPPPPPPPPPLPWRVGLRETLQPSGRAALKTALSAFIAVLVCQLFGYAPAGGLFAALGVSMQVSSGASRAKSLLVVAGIGLALAVMMLVVVPVMPNIDDPGSLLIMAAIAFAPTTWLAVGGPRVRNAGSFGTVLVAYRLFEDFRPAVDLEAPTVFGLTVAIGALSVGLVDLVVWPVDARRGMLTRVAMMMRDTADLYRLADPHVVLAPNRSCRWRAHRQVVAMVQLRGERLPLPGTPWWEPEEQALRFAAETQRLVVARVKAAEREIQAGAAPPGDEARRHAVAAQLEAQAADVERRYLRS